MESAIVFVNNQQVSILSTLEDLIKDINHYQAFWLSNTGSYTNNKNTYIKVHGLTNQDRQWLSARMK